MFLIIIDEVKGLKKEETGLSRRYLLNCRMSSLEEEKISLRRKGQLIL